MKEQLLINPSTNEKAGRKKFRESWNNTIASINVLIKEYNDKNGEHPDQPEATPLEKLRLLDAISTLKQQTERHFGMYLVFFPEILNVFHIDLSNQLRDEYQKLGVVAFQRLMADSSSQASSSSSSAPASSSTAWLEFEDLIAKMDVETLNKFTGILIHGAQAQPKELLNLYAESDPRQIRFLSFLQNNQIEFLSGANSKIFKVTPRHAMPYVLKLNYRPFDNSELVDRLAASPLAPHFPQTSVGYMASCISPVTSDKVVAYVQFMDFIPLGTVMMHDSDRGEERRMRSAGIIYSQMTELLIMMKNQGVVFPDMKNSNWLLNEQGILIIADTKSLIKSIEGTNGLVRAPQIDGDPPHDDFLIFKTKAYMPREIGDLAGSYNIAQAMSFTLGKNMYEYLLQAPAINFALEVDSRQLDFTARVFQTAEGKIMQELIMGLVRDDPDTRLSIEVALQTLQGIATMALTPQHEIDAMEHASVDLNHLINSIQMQIYELNALYEISWFNDEYWNKLIKESSSLNDLKSEPHKLVALKNILDTISSHQQVLVPLYKMLEEIYNGEYSRSRFSVRFINNSVSGGGHISQLLQSFSKIPLGERHKILNEDYLPGKEFREELIQYKTGLINRTSALDDLRQRVRENAPIDLTQTKPSGP